MEDDRNVPSFENGFEVPCPDAGTCLALSRTGRTVSSLDEETPPFSALEVRALEVPAGLSFSALDDEDFSDSRDRRKQPHTN